MSVLILSGKVDDRKSCIVKIVSLIFCLSVSLSCNRGKGGSTPDLDLSATDLPEISFAEISQNQDWIELENRDEAIVGHAKKVIEYQGYYYILDNYRQNRVLVFDKDGKYVRGIGQKGGGPGEYTDILDFTINRESGDVVILSDMSKVMVYSATGEFRFSKQLSESVLWSIVYSNGTYVCSTDHTTYTTGENAYLLYFFDSGFSETGKCVSVLPRQMRRLEVFSGQLTVQGSNIYYMDVFSQILYEIGLPETSPCLTIGIRLPDPMPLEVYREGMGFFEKQREHGWIKDFVPVNDRFLMSYVAKGDLYIAIVGMDGVLKKSGKYKGFYPISYPTESGRLISPINLDEYFGYWSKPGNAVDIPELTSESNMLLLKWNLKDI